MINVYLVGGREKSLLRRHPWIFSQAVKKVEGEVISGADCEIFDSKGQWLARGAYSPISTIRARVWTFDRDEKIDVAFFEKRIKTAKELRKALIAEKELSAYRLIAAESDLLPGLIADVYNDYIVLELLSAGIEYHKEELFTALKNVFPGYSIYERSDVAVRKKEGLKERTGVISGTEPPENIVMTENNGVKMVVDLKNGHKTGYYLDQRDNRAVTARYSENAKVLNCFSYTGGFALYALKGKAREVYNVDVSQAALDIARQNVEINGFDVNKVKFVKADVFMYLREKAKTGEKFDLIILDPPKFAENKSQLTGACRGYKDINRLAMSLLSPGGTLMTFSCSGLMTADLFQKVVADAALDAGRCGQIVQYLQQAADHPVGLPYPEGFYLKGLVVKMMD